jgi:protocatechuate 3,4-dioxygenase beta subunit
MEISKRGLLTHGVAWSAGAVAGARLIGRAAAATAKLQPTQRMDLGPFYPVERPLEEDADLTRLAGHKDRAKGAMIELTGRVLDPDGQPVPRARVEIWQANAVGRYRHHGDEGDPKRPLDENFQGDGVQMTDANGAFRFLTVRPGAYPAGDFMRSPHIHFDVAGKYDKLITQMYFPGESYLKQDKVLLHDIDAKHAPKVFPQWVFGKRTAAASTLEHGADLWRFDIVLADG